MLLDVSVLLIILSISRRSNLDKQISKSLGCLNVSWDDWFGAHWKPSLENCSQVYHLVCFCHWIISKALEQWIYQCTIHQVQDTNLKSRNSSPPFPCGRQNSKEIRYGCGQKRIKNMVVDMILPLVLFLFMAKHTTLQ